MNYSFDNILILGLLIHYVADFVCQTSYQSENKHREFGALINHVGSYTSVWCVCLFFFLSIDNSIDTILEFIAPFAIVTLVSHMVIDFFSSKATNYFFSRGLYHNGFLVVGIDQILHYIQLYYTYKYYICLPSS